MINKYFSDVVRNLKYILSTSQNSNNKQPALIKDCLLNSPSYRLLEKDNSDSLIGFKLWKHAVKKILLLSENYRIINKNNSEYAIYDGSYRSYDLRLNYVNMQADSNPRLFIGKEYLIYGEGFFLRLWLVIQVTIFSFPVIVKCFNNNNRASMALLIFEAIENACLLNILHKNKIKKIYDFLTYEIDSNFTYWMLNKHQIEVIKRPSAAPLFVHNSKMLADTLILTSQYQFEELNYYRNNSIFAKEVIKWLPENAFEYINLYTTPAHTGVNKYTIGYYSHASWIREQSGHTKIGLKIYEEEIEILGYLKIFLNKHPEYNLIVYTHPKEKKKEIISQTEHFYKQALGGCNFVISSDKTHLAFDKVNIAVCAFSTIIFDRLFAGFKTLIGIPHTDVSFPVYGSALNNICFKTYNELEKKIIDNTELNNMVYFQNNKLQEYRYECYPYFLKL